MVKCLIMVRKNVLRHIFTAKCELRCLKFCPNGYVLDKNGCQTCICKPPSKYIYLYKIYLFKKTKHYFKVTVSLFCYLIINLPVVRKTDLWKKSVH